MTHEGARATKVVALTEETNPRTAALDTLDAAGIVRLMNEEDKAVARAVESALPEVARVVESVVERMRAGGRLFYIGAGTSGRLGVLDAAECAPTFGIRADRVQGVIAGGYDALYKAVEASEDDTAAGASDLQAREVNNLDAVIGIAASGGTPYTIGALEWARERGALTACVTCVPASPITRAVEIPIVAATGAEVLTGSTRLKAGTAQKMILNMISTATMVRLGYVRGNRMTNLLPKNEKLRHRAARILAAETKLDEAAATELLAAAGDVPTALVMHETHCTHEEAIDALTSAHGIVREAVALVRGKDIE